MDAVTLLSRVREIGQFPDNDEDLTDTYILQEAYYALLERFTQPIITLRNGTWLRLYDFSLQAGVSMYRIPPRSIAQGLEKFEIATSSTGTNSQYRLMNVLTNIQSTDYEGNTGSEVPRCFTYVGDALRVYPTPTTSWDAHVWYYLRPGTLSTSLGPTITAVTPTGPSTYILTLSSARVGVTSCDIQHIDGNCEVFITDLPVSSIDTTHYSATLTPDQVSQIKAGSDLFNTPGVTNTIPLPLELSNALVSYVAAVCLALKGDADKAEVFSQKCETAIKNIVDLALPRSKGQPSEFKTRNTYLRRRVGRWGMGGWGGV